MEIKQITIYEFKELNDSAKEQAIEDFRNGKLEEYGWWDFLIDDFLSNVKEEHDLDFKQDDISFSLDREYHISINDSKVQNELCNKFCDKGLIDVDLPNRFGLYSNHLGGGIMSALTESEIYESLCELEYENEENELKEVVKQNLHKLETKKINDSVTEILYDLHEKLRTLLKAVQEEYEYRLSDESIIEDIEINEYKFNENGTLE